VAPSVVTRWRNPSEWGGALRRNQVADSIVTAWRLRSEYAPWQTLPRFQRTRGVLRMLALCVSKAYQEGYRGGRKETLIGLGSAPLEDPMFRSVIFEQLDEERLEAAITTDICGKPDSHATRLDQEAVEAIKKSRLHRKAGVVILFESNRGTTSEDATMPEVRLALGEPDLDSGNVETVMTSADIWRVSHQG
jgi:hypothetical protein